MERQPLHLWDRLLSAFMPVKASRRFSEPRVTTYRDPEPGHKDNGQTHAIISCRINQDHPCMEVRKRPSRLG
jgi:hypothetical protein